MSKSDKTAEALDQVMRDAVASAERIERAKHPDPNADEVTAEVSTEAEGPAMQAQMDALREQLLRMAADFDNYRKRSRREQEDARRFGNDRLLYDRLPVIDNLDRALSHSEGHADPVIAGVRMVAKQFHDILATQGVKAFVSEGTPFDPEKHEAVGQEESHDVPAGAVLREMQAGYVIHERLLRPARVLVATAPASDKDKSTKAN